jgi:hypothetical protein
VKPRVLLLSFIEFVDVSNRRNVKFGLKDLNLSRDGISIMFKNNPIFLGGFHHCCVVLPF